MSLFTDIVKTAIGAATSGQAETQTQNLLNGALSMLDQMGGIQGLVNKFQQSGLGDVAASWVGTGENKGILPDQLAKVLGNDQIAALAQQAGIPEAQGASVLSQLLPNIVDKLTPDGQAPDSGSNLATIGKVLLGGVGVAAAAKVAASFFGDKDEEQAGGSAASTSAPAAESSAAAGSGARTYTVASGDTLSKIAKQFYNDANQWPKIFDANKDILSNPDRIMPGQNLRIP